MTDATRQSLGHSFGCAFAGLARVVFFERNAQIEMSVALLVAAAATFFHVGGWQLTALLVCIFGVLSLEVLNSALEATVDLASPEYHPLAKRAKDAAAGAVLIAALGSVTIGCLVFVPRLARYQSYLRQMTDAAWSLNFYLYWGFGLAFSVYLIWAVAYQLWCFNSRSKGKSDAVR